MACDFGHFVDAEHFRLAAKARLELPVVHPGGAAGDDQHDALADPQAQRFRDPRRLDAIGCGRQRHRGRTVGRFDHGNIGGLLGKKRANGFQAHIQDSWAATRAGSSDSVWMRWSGSSPSSSIWVRIALNIVSGATRSLLTDASAIASGVTRSIQATFSPNALAPQASHGFDDTNSTSVGGTSSVASIRA